MQQFLADLVAEKAMPKAGDVVAGKYEIERTIGEGGMGAVFSAMHKLTGKRVALKWMLPELARDEDAVQRFMREAQAAGRINHPNVVDVYDVGQHDDSFFLVMEFLQGEPLTAALERKGLAIGEILDLILPAMRGVAAAHRQGVVHRDLKPDNIFLVRDEDTSAPVPKVLDFGISKIAGTEGQVNPRLTKTGAVVGTPYYMSPEQIRGSHSVDKRADVYAFGVILYEALTGQVPFTADSYSALILEIATGTPRNPAEIAEMPPELGAVVLKAMAREVVDRYQDLESLGAALEPFAAVATMRGDRRDPTGRMRVQTASPVQIQVKPLGDTMTPFVASERPVVPRSSTPRLAVVAVAAGLLLALAAWLFTRSGAPDTAQHVVTPAVAAAAAPPVAPAAPVAPEPAVPVAPAAIEVATPAPAIAAPVVDEPAEAKSRKSSRSHRSALAATVAPSAVPVAAPARPARSGNARSGSLSVDEF